MKSMIPVWVVVIDKSTTSYPMYVKNVLVDYRILWNYYQHDDRSFEGIVKEVLGIDEEAPVVFNSFCDYLIHPVTGEVLKDGSPETLGQFMMKSFRRHVELIESAGRVAINMAMA